MRHHGLHEQNLLMEVRELDLLTDIDLSTVERGDPTLSESYCTDAGLVLLRLGTLSICIGLTRLRLIYSIDRTQLADTVAVPVLFNVVGLPRISGWISRTLTVFQSGTGPALSLPTTVKYGARPRMTGK